MNMVLTGGIPLSPQKSLVSPGMLSPPPEVGGASLVPVGGFPYSLSPPSPRQVVRSPHSLPLSAAAIAASMRSLAHPQLFLPHLGQQGLLGTSPEAAFPPGFIGTNPYFQVPANFPQNLIRIPHLSPPLQEDPLARFSLINQHPQFIIPSPQQLLLSSLMAQGGPSSSLLGGSGCSSFPPQNVAGKRPFEEAFPSYDPGVMNAKRWQQSGSPNDVGVVASRFRK